jgi:hypothetical protein
MTIALILALFFVPMAIGYLSAKPKSKSKPMVDWSVYDTPTYLRR